MAAIGPLWYPLALESLMQAQINLASGNVKVWALDSTYVYSATDQYMQDVINSSATCRLGSATLLTGKDFTAGQFTANMPVTLTGISGNPIAALLVYVDSGADATSPLLVFDDRKADSTTMSLAAGGLDVDVDWPGNLIAGI